MTRRALFTVSIEIDVDQTFCSDDTNFCAGNCDGSCMDNGFDALKQWLTNKPTPRNLEYYSSSIELIEEDE